MSYADEAALKAHILRVTRRGGDAVFDAEWPRLLAKAEQRIRYGAGEPVRTPPVRVRGFETSAALTFTSGAANLPADYMRGKALTWGGANEPYALTYRTPDFFASVVSSGGIPSIFTVEGSQFKIKPVASGSATLVYFQRMVSATAGQNWLMANAPGIYENAVLYEAYRFLRNADEADRALADYAAAVNGLNATDDASRHAGPLYPRIRGANVRRSGSGGALSGGGAYEDQWETVEW